MYMPRGGFRFERSAAAAAAALWLCAARFEGVKLSGPEMGRRLPVRLTKRTKEERNEANTAEGVAKV